MLLGSPQKRYLYKHGLCLAKGGGGKALDGGMI